MAGGFVICEYGDVRAGFSEFKKTMDALRTTLIEKAEADWKPLTYTGRTKASFAALGVTPGPGLQVQSRTFGESTVIPALFSGMGMATALTTWVQFLTATGSQLVLTGAGTSHSIAEDYKIGMAGIAILDKAVKITEIKLQIGDKKLPRINIEEAMAYDEPAVIFEEGFILDEETAFDMLAYVQSIGYQKIKIIGLQLNRVYDKMLTNPGSALT